MKIDFSIVLLDLDDKPLKIDDKDATLGGVVINALMASFADEQSLSGEKKLERFRLAKLAKKGGKQEVMLDDVVLFKTLIGKAYGPLVVGQVWIILEGSPELSVVSKESV